MSDQPMTNLDRATIVVIGLMFNSGFKDHAHALRYLRVVVRKLTPRKYYESTANRFHVDPDELWQSVESALERESCL